MRYKWGLFTMILAALAMGCSSTAPPPSAELEERVEFAEEYLIGIGDNLQITVWRHPDLSIGAPVRPDGKVTVPVAGDVMVGGKTPDQVGEVISTALSEYIREPVVTVSVTNISGADYLTRVRVTGAVGGAASLPYRQGMTVLDVVLDAGGVTEFANPSKTILYRKTGEKLQVRLDRILSKGDLSTNFPVRPGDIITVPESAF